jgi:hypothetical protein
MALKFFRSFGDEATALLPRKPGIGKRLILISAGIVCVSFIARIVYYLVGEEPPTTDKAFVEGNTYLVSSNHH